MPQRDIFNARTQKVEPAELVVDKNGEIVATFYLRDEAGVVVLGEDGLPTENGFLKFPSQIVELTEDESGQEETTTTPITAEQLNGLITKHEQANTGQEIITPEKEAADEAARANVEALIAGDQPAEGDKTDDTPTEQPTDS